MLSAYYICCIYSNALQNTFVMEANTMNPDQTAPKGAVWSGSILFAIKIIKVHKQMREQTTIIVINSGEKVKKMQLSL